MDDAFVTTEACSMAHIWRERQEGQQYEGRPLVSLERRRSHEEKLKHRGQQTYPRSERRIAILLSSDSFVCMGASSNLISGGMDS